MPNRREDRQPVNIPNNITRGNNVSFSLENFVFGVDVTNASFGPTEMPQPVSTQASIPQEPLGNLELDREEEWDLDEEVRLLEDRLLDSKRFDAAQRNLRNGSLSNEADLIRGVAMEDEVRSFLNSDIENGRLEWEDAVELMGRAIGNQRIMDTIRNQGTGVLFLASERRAKGLASKLAKSNSKLSNSFTKKNTELQEIAIEDLHAYLSTSNIKPLLLYGIDSPEFKEILEFKGIKLKEQKVEKLNEKEEAIINVSELADYYATLDCQSTIENFDLETHNKEYNDAYKKHMKNIVTFKRNTNG